VSSHSIDAVYSGDTDFVGSKATLTESMVGTFLSNQEWAGYRQFPPTGVHYTGIVGAFKVPTVTGTQCPSGAGDPCRKASTWVGIGTDTTRQSLVQAGIEEDLSQSGKPNYYAFEETVGPGGQRLTFPLTINAGDLVQAAVWETTTNNWRLQVFDYTSGQGKAFFTTFTSLDNSAEAIHELTGASGGLPAGLSQTTNAVFDAPAGVLGLSYTTSSPSQSPVWQPFFPGPPGNTMQEPLLRASGPGGPNPYGDPATPSSTDSDNDGFQVQDGTTAPAAPPSSDRSREPLSCVQCA
jgi:Peptidase A4 family